MDKLWNTCAKIQKGLFSLVLLELGQGKDLDFFSHIQRKLWKACLVLLFVFLLLLGCFGVFCFSFF